MKRVRIQREAFDLNVEIAKLHGADPRVGAICSFVGTVRDRSDGNPCISLELEHYPVMTEKSIESMIDQATNRFGIYSATVVHRIGMLQPLEQIVMVAVTSAHRADSFKACEFLMDYLKTQAPFWKKEGGLHGAQWVDARSGDDLALAKWGIDLSNAPPESNQ